MSRTIFFPSDTLIYGISRDGSKKFNTCTCEHMILGQLMIGARQTKNAPLLRSLSYLGKFCCYRSNETPQRKRPFWRKRFVQTTTGYNIKQYTNISITFNSKVYELWVTDTSIQSWTEVNEGVYFGKLHSLFFILITQSKVHFVRRSDSELFIAFVC